MLAEMLSAPARACFELADAEDQFLPLASDFTFVGPYLTLDGPASRPRSLPIGPRATAR